ncbi:MAG: putative metalloprotease CJM1_0395 family protein [Gammaproteobacteria bacterium]|nr:putative metalloprotease CJM1_0395 family protein [Gammaproteobacteria bacterium]
MKIGAANPTLIQSYTQKTSSCSSCEPEQKTKQDERLRAEQSETAKRTAELSQTEKAEVAKLQTRDREVKAHEAAHAAAAGGLANGGPSYSYQTGPDGKRYAVGGEVSIDISAVPNDPQATIEKANQIRAAALAPADPSSADRAIAAQATRMAAQARVELMKENSQEDSPSAKQENRGIAEYSKIADEGKDSAGTNLELRA